MLWSFPDILGTLTKQLICHLFYFILLSSCHRFLYWYFQLWFLYVSHYVCVVIFVFPHFADSFLFQVSNSLFPSAIFAFCFPLVTLQTFRTFNLTKNDFDQSAFSRKRQQQKFLPPFLLALSRPKKLWERERERNGEKVCLREKVISCRLKSHHENLLAKLPKREIKWFSFNLFSSSFLVFIAIWSLWIFL